MPRKTAFQAAAVFALSLLGNAALAATPVMPQPPIAAHSSGEIILAQAGDAAAPDGKAAKKEKRAAKAAKDKADKEPETAKKHRSRKAEAKETAAEAPQEQPQQKTQAHTPPGSAGKNLRQAAGGENCPCTGGAYCTGPRGGHYCYSASGKKRYLKRSQP